MVNVSLKCRKCNNIATCGSMKSICGVCRCFRSQKAPIQKSGEDLGKIDYSVKLNKHQVELQKGYKHRYKHYPNYYWVKYHDMRKWLQWLVVNDVDTYDKVKDYGTEPNNYDQFMKIVGGGLPPVY